MARELVIRCEVGGEEGALEYQLTLPDGEVWKADLCDKHAGPIVKVFQKGTQALADGKGGVGIRLMEGRIRGVPQDGP